MKLILLVVIGCLAIHNGNGAPKTAVYRFVRCNPEGNQANCVTHQSPEMAWTPDLPAKLPASTAQYLDAVPVEDQSPMNDEEGQEEVVEDETPIMTEKGEPSVINLPEFGSGTFEGSAEDIPVADQPFETAESEIGSGESWTERGGNMMGRLLSRSLVGEAKPAEEELKEDHLLQL